MPWGRWLAFSLTIISLLVPGSASAISSEATVSFSIAYPTGDVRITGDAFPGALVTILDNGSVAGTTVANSVSFFDKTITGLNPTVHTIGVYAQTDNGKRSLTISFDLTVISGTLITVSGLLLPPIITVPETIKRPAKVEETGVARHNSTVTTFTSNGTDLTNQTTSSSSGSWSIKVDKILHLGTRSVSGLVQDGLGTTSSTTNPETFRVLLSADLNLDNKVSLTDFSILMFSYAQSPVPNLAADINDNGPSDLVDFSIMMFYWTG